MPDGESALASKFEVLARVLDERTWRLVAAAEAEAMGFGGVTAVAGASGLSRGTVIRGMAELKVAPEPARGQRIRRRGAGQQEDHRPGRNPEARSGISGGTGNAGRSGIPAAVDL